MYSSRTSTLVLLSLFTFFLFALLLSFNNNNNRNKNFINLVVVEAKFCGSGKYFSSLQCKSCPCGKYCDGWDDKSCSSGTYQPSTRKSSCNDCPVGHKCPSSKMCSATKCAAGTYQDKTKQTACKTCSAGETSSAGATSCDKCDPGKFCSSSSGCSSCTKCSAGHFSAVSGASNCDNTCAAGTYAPAGSTECSTCQPGTYSLAVAGSCTPCAKGHFQGRTGRSSCDACPSGQYADTTGSRTCKDAQPGSFAPSPGSIESTLCSAGQYQDETAQSSCKLCPAGTYSSEGASECIPCPVGTYCATAGSCPDKCEKCAAGTDQNVTGSTSCRACDAGKFSSEGAENCSPCAAGTECPSGSCQDGCQNCNPGWFSAKEGWANCQPCEIGSYNNVTASDRCYKCDIRNGKWTFSTGSTGCVPCQCTPTYSETASLSQSPSHSKSKSHSHTESLTSAITISSTDFQTLSQTHRTPTGTFSKDQNSSTSSETKTEITLSYSDSHNHNSTTLSDTVEKTTSVSKTQPTESALTATSGELNNAGHQTDTDSLPSLSLSFDTASRSDSAVTETKLVPSFTTGNTLSQEVTRETKSSSVSISAPTEEKTTSHSHSIQHFPPPEPLGLSAATQQALQTSTSTTSSAMSLAAAPAALAVERSLAIMGLIGCDATNPATGKEWSETRLVFPKSLLPGVGFGPAKGYYYRGAVLGFLVLLVVAFIVGYLLIEGVGKERVYDVNVTDSDDDDDEDNNKESNKSTTPSSSMSLSKSISSSSSTSTKKKPNHNNTFSFSSKFRDIAEKIKHLKVRRIPQIIYTAVSAVLGMWAPAAGILFSTFEPLDICIAMIPIVCVFALHFYMAFRIGRSISKMEKEGKGLLFTNSMILEGNRGAVKGRENIKKINEKMDKLKKKKNNDNKKQKKPKSLLSFTRRQQQNEFEENDDKTLIDRFDSDEEDDGDEESHHHQHQYGRKKKTKTWWQKLSSTTIRSFLMSPPGRFFLLGHHFWTRPKGPDGQEARRLIAMVGNHIQKFKGPRCVINFLATANPFKISKKSGVARINISNLNELRDFEEREQPEIEILEEDQNNLALRISPHFLLICWVENFIVGFSSGIARSHPSTCPAIIKMIASINIFSFLLVCYLRPFVVPVRNYLTLVLEFIVCFVSIVAAFVLAENSNVADGGVTPKVEWKNGIAKWIQIIIPIVASICGFTLIFLQITRRFLLFKGKLSLATHEELWAFQEYYVGEMMSETQNMKKSEAEVDSDLMERMLYYSDDEDSSSSDDDDENDENKMIDKYLAPKLNQVNYDDEEDLEEFFSPTTTTVAVNDKKKKMKKTTKRKKSSSSSSSPLNKKL